MTPLKRPDFRRIHISAFNNVFSTQGRKIPLGDFLDMVMQDNPQVKRLRKEMDPRKQKEIKQTLPAFAISATFREDSPGRDLQSIEAPTGLICVDVDASDNKGITANSMKRIFSECEQTLYCAKSARGQGVFVIMRLLFPRAFKDHFRALQRMIKDQLGLTIDSSCSDPTRLRLLSHDPEPYINENAETFALLDPIINQPPERQRTIEESKTTNTPADVYRNVKSCVDRIRETGTDIAQTYDEWINVGFALHTLGAVGKEYFRTISDQWSRGTTSDKKLNNFWKSIHNDDRANAITIGTFFHQCKEYGIYPDVDNNYGIDPGTKIQGFEDIPEADKEVAPNFIFDDDDDL